LEFPVLGQALSIEFANTVWFGGGRIHDALEGADVADRWLAAMAPRYATVLAGGPDRRLAPVDERLRTQLVALRGTVRELFTALAARTAPGDEVLARLSAASRESPRWLEASLQPDGGVVTAPRRSGGDPARALIAALADDALTLAGGPESRRLLSCPCPGCLGFFLQDDPRRRFCSPTCSTRWRVSRHYSRHRTGPPPAAKRRIKPDHGPGSRPADGQRGSPTAGNPL